MHGSTSVKTAVAAMAGDNKSQRRLRKKEEKKNLTGSSFQSAKVKNG